jgi:ATP-dependent exoDNAse (exonuclease V) beta subunit
VSAAVGPLADQRARDRIRSDLDRTLFVSAGAGSGKTTELVERVLALVRAGTPVDRLAAITFTEKSADELRDRIRRELERHAERAEDPAARRACAVALDDLDQAAICTLHSFAQRVLTAFPLEAGVPPAFAVLDEITSDRDFEERWQAFYDELVERPELDRTMTLALELGIKPEHLRSVAEQLDDSWDRVRVPAAAPEPPPLDAAPVVDAGRALLDACALVGPGDALAGALLVWLPGWLESLMTAGDELDLLDALQEPRPPPMRGGTAAGWRRTAYADPASAREAVKDLVRPDRPGGPLTAVLGAVVGPILARLSAELSRFTLQQAERRRRSGQLTFHDLLVLCRRVLEDPVHGARVRVELARRFEVLLVDEYQDTDPLQLDIVVAIATPPGDDRPRPGQLFFVGDPKQSLYRFRRADINLFLRTPARVDADEVSLTSNFRSTPPILTWINHVFGQLIVQCTADDGETLAQPDYEPLDAMVGDAVDGPPVAVLGSEPHAKGTLVAELRRREADDVAATIALIRDEGWTVRRGAGPDAAAGAARLRDIAILIPARTMLGQLETALRDAGIPYQLDTGSLVYAADEIRALLLALRAIADPSDHLAVMSVLRSPLFGCSDVELYRWRRQRHGGWNPQAPLPQREDGHDVVWDAMADLRERIADRASRSPSEHLESLVRDRRVLETALASPGAFDAWHRVRFVIEQARAWSDAGGRFLRDYLDWTRRQKGLTGRVAEVALDAVAGDDSALDAVRILTIHGAKGLEFPIALVCGLNSGPGHRHRGVQVSWGDDGQVLRLRDKLKEAGFDERRAIDEQMDQHERTRLLYVACTRARDHLVVSLHRVTDAGPTGAHVIAGCAVGPGAVVLPVGLQVLLAPGPARPPPPPPAAPLPEPSVLDLARWRAERDDLVRSARRPGAVSATALAARRLLPIADSVDEDEGRFSELEARLPPGLAKRSVDLDLPAWRKGRYGTAIGRAVHAVLQAVDLRSGAGLEDLARGQAAAEGVEGEHERIAELARSALRAPSVQAAAAGEHWREVYVGAPVGGEVLEGYIDLLYRGPEGLVVVDHKTDQVTTEDEVASRLGAYRLQLAAYALALERATGETVVDARLVFCARAGAREEPVADLRAAMAEAEALLASRC